jgi:class 3 adenylate cyclase
MNFSDSKNRLTGERIERRLAAILVADVVRYSRLMRNDEEATHRRLTALRSDAVLPTIRAASWRRAYSTYRTEQRIRMKRLMISALAAAALIAAATTVLRSHSPSTDRAAGMMSLQELHTAAGVTKLPIEDFEDMSLVYSTATKR